MARLDDGSANKSVRPPITFGVSKLWIPHVALICFIHYVSRSPQQYGDQHAFWTFGTYMRVLAGGRVTDAGVAFMWAIHLLEAGYTAILARRYETTMGVGMSYVIATLIFGGAGWQELSNRAQRSSARSKVA